MSNIKIYTGPSCPSCKLLKEKLKNHPKRDIIEWKDVSDVSNNADAIMDGVMILPTAIDGNGKMFTGVGTIIQAVERILV